MRMLVALGGEALRRAGDGEEGARREVEAAARALASLAGEHEVVLAHGSEGATAQLLDLTLRNALPDRDLVTLVTKVIVSAGDPAFGPRGPAAAPPSPEPSAITELRSLRMLVDAGAVVVCAGGGGAPIALDELGAMHAVEAEVDEALTAALLARRLEADLLVMLSDPSGPMKRRVEAANRFVEATGRRAAIGALSEAVEVARGTAGAQISPHGA